ncbi:MarR family transcriptional regulator [Mucilaginibacter sp. RS28]|uniref:MarR family transcriptional regulator n=1 Tax=Mucilaginibacter straminoryzae TaxID=2932774 RepID=A0A9X2BBG4_9SPHI|nr:MarR family transcriptional regulator [Mucilaginibacter straminoryzae]MCJ8208203.1 MarR family transcriptional regulator [Mucilaginibacter straminoryzae]
MELTTPISRKLIQTGRLYLNVLARQVTHLDINRYYDILNIIYSHNGQLTQKALSQMLNKDKSAMVSIIDYLTQQGYVYREKNPNDRREHLLKITEKGAKDVQEVILAFKQLNQHATENIPEDQLTIFKQVLSQIEYNLKQHLINQNNSEFTPNADYHNI